VAGDGEARGWLACELDACMTEAEEFVVREDERDADTVSPEMFTGRMI
jgi:hypothetical protein